MKNILISGWILIVISGLIFANEDYKDHPGYIDLSGIYASSDDDNKIEKNFKVSFVNSDGEEDSLYINIKTLHLDGENTDWLQSEISKIEKKMNRDHWSAVVRVKSGEEITNISIRKEGNEKKAVGLMIMSVKPGKEAAFVNIAGSITPDMLNDLDLNIYKDDMGKIKASIHSKSEKEDDDD